MKKTSNPLSPQWERVEVRGTNHPHLNPLPSRERRVDGTLVLEG